MYFSQKVLLSGLQISSIITVQVRTTTYTSCFVARWTFSKSCSTRLSPPARPLSPSVSVFPFLCLLSRCEERSNIPSNHIQSLCFFFHPVALRHHKAFKQGQSCGGGVGVELRVFSAASRGEFSPSFVLFPRCILTFLSATTPVGSRHQTPYSVSLFLFAPTGVPIIIQHGAVLCTIENHLGCISNWHT